MMLRLYWVVPCKDNEWGVLVVHETAKQAKLMGFKAVKDIDEWCEYLQCRVTLNREIAVPAEITEPMVIDCCADAPWTCEAWNMEGCYTDCARYAAKLKRSDSEDD
jgi:hypothetical protein